MEITHIITITYLILGKAISDMMTMNMRKGRGGFSNPHLRRCGAVSNNLRLIRKTLSMAISGVSLGEQSNKPPSV